MTTRRSFLLGAAALLATPAVVRPGILMPVKRLLPPPIPKWCPPGWLPCDGRIISAADYPAFVNLFGSVLPDLRPPFRNYPESEPTRYSISPDGEIRPRNFALETIVCTHAEGHPLGMVSTIIARE